MTNLVPTYLNLHFLIWFRALEYHTDFFFGNFILTNKLGPVNELMV